MTIRKLFSNSRKSKATKGSIRKVRINEGTVRAIRGFTKDDDQEWGLSWTKEKPEEVRILKGDFTGVEFFPNREINIHTHHNGVVSNPSAVDLANILDAKEMISIVSTPYGLHVFRKGKEDKKIPYDEALEITKTWYDQDFDVNNIGDLMATYGIEYKYMSWKEAEENGIDIDKVFRESK